MVDFRALSRRERQIMDILYSTRGATVMQVVSRLPDPPSDKAVRRLLQILEEKGHVRRNKVGREYRYHPVQSRKQAAKQALQRLLDTFFDGAPDKLLMQLIETNDVSPDEFAEMRRLIDNAEDRE